MAAPLDAVPPGEDKAVTLRALVVELDERLGRPTDRRVLRAALDHADALAGHDPATTVVLHGDAHPGNALPVSTPGRGRRRATFRGPGRLPRRPGVRRGRGAARLVLAPDRSRRPWRLDGWCDLVAERTGVDPARVRAWAFLERVSTGLYVTSFGAERVGRRFLATAAHLLG